jgi:hypothetical protein
MARKKSGSDVVSQKLHEAIDGLRKDVTRVEIWATALLSFAKPVPDYQPDRTHELGPGDEGSDPAVGEPSGATTRGTGKGRK